jgi:hypothetical protein
MRRTSGNANVHLDKGIQRPGNPVGFSKDATVHRAVAARDDDDRSR